MNKVNTVNNNLLLMGQVLEIKRNE